MPKPSLFMQFKDVIAKKYGDNLGKMLIHTGVIGWILSSAAQVAAIVINDKIPKEQKMFLIPQEIADAGVNIVLRDAKLPNNLVEDFKKFDSGIDFISTTLGSILSCNIVTPIIRNEIAAERQKSGIAKMNSNTTNKTVASVDTENVNIPLSNRATMNNFQSMAYNKYSHPASSLKI